MDKKEREKWCENFECFLKCMFVGFKGRWKERGINFKVMKVELCEGYGLIYIVSLRENLGRCVC